MRDWDKLMDPARSALEALIASGDAMADRIEELEAKLAKDDALMSLGFAEYERRLAEAVEAAYCEGFAEGYGGEWIEGDYSKPWRKSVAFAELKGDKT